MEWTAGRMPEKIGDYLVTLYGDSIGENYVIHCRYESIPATSPCRFYRISRNGLNEDITDYVIAWMKFPDAYEKTHNPINSICEDAWVSQHL